MKVGRRECVREIKRGREKERNRSSEDEMGKRSDTETNSVKCIGWEKGRLEEVIAVDGNIIVFLYIRRDGLEIDERQGRRKVISAAQGATTILVL
jgi:hypothetical protein